MTENTPSPLGNVISIDDERIKNHLDRVVRGTVTKAAELVEAAVEETLSYYSFPEEHWRRIRTNNPLERILREIRRRTRVVGAFPAAVDRRRSSTTSADQTKYQLGSPKVSAGASVDKFKAVF